MTQVRKQRSPPVRVARPRVPSTPRQAAAQAGPIDALLNPELFRALSDPTRVALLACIAKCARGCSVGEVAQCCSVDLSVVSRHLSVLARAGVLQGAKDGRTVRYSVRYHQLSCALRSLASALDDCCPVADPNQACCDDACCP